MMQEYSDKPLSVSFPAECGVGLPGHAAQPASNGQHLFRRAQGMGLRCLRCGPRAPPAGDPRCPDVAVPGRASDRIDVGASGYSLGIRQGHWRSLQL